MERGDIPYSPAVAVSALQWWADAGVDVIVEEEPRDWLRPQPKAPQAAASRPEAAVSPPAAADVLPDQLALFQAWLRDSDDIPFAAPSAPRICPSGDPAAGLMILADMPAGEDCRAGALLSGEAGRLFDRMMAAIGRDRSTLYLAALSCLRAPDGRLGGEAAARCALLARHHVALARPKALLLLGDACSKALLGLPMAKARGRWHELATDAGPIRTLVSISPSYLLDQPSAKKLAWADLQMLAEGLKP